MKTIKRAEIIGKVTVAFNLGKKWEKLDNGNIGTIVFDLRDAKIWCDENTINSYRIYDNEEIMVISKTNLQVLKYEYLTEEFRNDDDIIAFYVRAICGELAKNGWTIV